MSKSKSISELVEELQAENESLQSLKKLFNQACKNEFGYDVKTLHDIILKWKRLEKKTAQPGQQNQNERSEF
jgi:uncharacterized protein (UPF0335 family)